MASQRRNNSQPNTETDGKRMFLKRSQAAVQNLHMSQDNQEMIQSMFRDLQVDCLSDNLVTNNLQLDERYWGRVGDQRLKVKGVTVFPEWESADKFSEEANQYALKRLTQCGFDKGRCLAALSKCDDDVGAALEYLICSCCEIKHNENHIPDDDDEMVEAAKQQREEECLALKSIYDDTFTESISDKLWTMNISMEFLEEKFKTSSKIPVRKDPKKIKKQNFKGKNVCRYFLMGKCTFGSRCKMSHAVEEEGPKVDDQHLKIPEKPVQYVLEVRFPKRSLYPFEQPVLVFYTTSEVVPSFVSLNITKVLNEEAKEISDSDSPVVFSAISILEDKERILACASMQPPEFSLPEIIKVQAASTVSYSGSIEASSSNVNKHASRGAKKDLKSHEKEALSKKLKQQFDKQKVCNT